MAQGRGKKSGGGAVALDGWRPSGGGGGYTKSGDDGGGWRCGPKSDGEVRLVVGGERDLTYHTNRQKGGAVLVIRHGKLERPRRKEEASRNQTGQAEPGYLGSNLRIRIKIKKVRLIVHLITFGLISGMTCMTTRPSPPYPNDIDKRIISIPPKYR